ncbi:MAG: hypothetical protein IT228_10485 [Flavobacteriales bacterium]|nr:hypothetical protein [Flavobacteriales bacterium]MCC6577757.1 hypothetical protein [Flavobacteriales bacterium]NUQ15351.1 hypothetical protein [Flavobacteriales bacterium]
MKRTLLLVLLALVLGGLAWWTATRDKGTTLSGPLTDFAVADTAAVDRIFIAEPDGRTVDLRRRPGGGWTLNGRLEANPVPVNLLLKTFLRVEVRAPVPKSAEANVLRVMAGTAKRVEIYTGGDRPDRIWFVGHSTKDHFGTYMVLEKPGTGRSEVPFVMGMSGFTGYLTPRFHADPDVWRSSILLLERDLGALRELRIDRPAAPGTGVRLALEGQGGPDLLDDAGNPLPMDTAAVMDMLRPLQGLNFEYVERQLTPAERDSVLHSTPLHLLTLVRRDGSTRRIPFWTKGAYPGQRDAMGTLMKEEDVDRLYAAIDDTVLVAVQRLGADRLLVPREALLRHP